MGAIGNEARLLEVALVECECDERTGATADQDAVIEDEEDDQVDPCDAQSY